MSLLWNKWLKGSVKLYYVILRYRYFNQCIYIFLNKVGAHAQKCHQYNEIFIDCFINTFIS